MSTPQDPWQVSPQDSAPSPHPDAVPGYGPPPQGWGAPPSGGSGGAPLPSSYGQPPQQWGGPPQTEPKAVVALVLAVAAYVAAPFIAAIAALVVGHLAKRDIDASGGRLGGRGLVVAAFWISVIHLAFIALLVVGFAALVALGGTTFS